MLELPKLISRGVAFPVYDVARRRVWNTSIDVDAPGIRTIV